MCGFIRNPSVGIAVFLYKIREHRIEDTTYLKDSAQFCNIMHGKFNSSIVKMSGFNIQAWTQARVEGLDYE